MTKEYNTTITDFHGYLNRKSFFAVIVITSILQMILRVILLPEGDEPSLNLPLCYEVLLYMLWGFILYIVACAYAKRLNDLQWSKWNLVLIFIPIIAIFVAIPCIFKKGVEDENRVQ